MLIVIKCRTSLRLWEKMDGLILQILMIGSNGILDFGQVEDIQMIKNKLIDEK